ncbi:MAG: ATP-binding protein [Bacteroidia bacterium]
MRILLLEDNNGDADLIQLHLKRSGFHFLSCVVADRGRYINALSEFRPGLILCDHNLPSFDSTEAYKVFREFNYDIPFILVTGAVSEEFAAETIKSGVDDYVLKSNLTRLPAAIRSSLQKKASEQKNKIADERIARAHRIARLGHWEWDLIHNTMDWSEETYRIFGLNAEHLEAGYDRFRVAVHPDDRKMVAKALQQIILKGADYNLDHRVLRPDGEIRYVNEQADVVYDAYGHAIRITGALVDITERKIFEQRLDNERKFLQAVLDNINVGIQACDSEGKIILYNEALKKIMNLPAIEFHKDQWSGYYKANDGVTGEPVSPDMDPLFRSLKGEFVVNQTYNILPLNGIERFVSVNAQPLLDDQGRLFGAVAATHDLTLLRQSEKKLQHKIEELDLFIYKASHDLKGPLSSMAGLLNLAKLEIKDPSVQVYLDKLEQSNNKLEMILHGLLEVVQIKQGKPAIGSIKIYNLVQDILNSLRNLPNCDRVRFILEMDPADVFVNDERILRGILQNLIHNSIKYKREIQDPFILIRGVRMQKQYMLEVQDNGIGIREELREKIFDMFFRGHHTSTGSGLGLYLVKNAVEKLNGKIEVKSHYGKSTSFILHLPDASVQVDSDPVEKKKRTGKTK